MQEPQNPTTLPGSPAFPTTHWSAVFLAGHGQDSPATNALDKLCGRYWYPLYAYARRSGNDPDQSRDLTQGFFARILGNQFLAKADENRGRFRSYLLKSFQLFIREEWDKARAAKRGGGVEHISLDPAEAETRYSLEPPDEMDAVKIFERRWAVSIIEQTLERLEDEFKSDGKSDQFAAMQPFLVGDTDETTSQGLAGRLGIEPGAARVALHRFRERYRALFREQVAQTVDNERDLEDELRHIFRTLSS